jgi:hypothetical protein
MLSTGVTRPLVFENVDILYRLIFNSAESAGEPLGATLLAELSARHSILDPFSMSASAGTGPSPAALSRAA